MKKYITLIIVFMLSFSTLVYADYNLYFNGELFNFEKSPVMIENRVFYPMRELVENFGGVVTWYPETETATTVLDDNVVSFTLKTNKYVVNNEILIMDENIKPVIIDGSMYLPIRYLAESFSYLVGWDSEKKAVVVDTETFYLNNPDLADENDKYILKFYLQYLNTISELFDFIDQSSTLEDKHFYTRTTLNYVENVNNPEASDKIKVYQNMVLEINSHIIDACNEALTTGDFDNIDSVHLEINQIIEDSKNYNFFQ